MAVHVVRDMASASRARRRIASAFSVDRFQARVATATNDVANKIKSGLTREITRRFDRPTPFTVDSVKVIPARKQNLRQINMTVHIGRIQSEYLKPHILGGSTGQTSFVPVVSNIQRFGVRLGIRLDQYGNIENLDSGYFRALLSDPRLFIPPSNSRLPRGIYFRDAGRPVPMFVERDNIEHEVIFPFHELSLELYRQCFPAAWRSALR